jgi:hypothetical protein
MLFPKTLTGTKEVIVAPELIVMDAAVWAWEMHAAPKANGTPIKEMKRLNFSILAIPPKKRKSRIFFGSS